MKGKEMGETIRLQLLGPIQIFVEDQPVKGFESQKAIALLCYLTYTGQPVSRSKLANLFWGNKTEAHGLANLSRVLHRNRQLVPGCWQISYKLVRFANDGTCWTDTKHFDDLIARGDLDSYIEAIDLYQGDFMEGVSLVDCPEFENWLIGEQELWRQKVSAAHNHLISIFYQQGNYTEAIKYASHLLILDPWREEAHQQMMLLLALSGQRLTALQQYKICCNALEQGLDVGPSEETKALYEKILNGENLIIEHARLAALIPNTATPMYNFPAQLPRHYEGDAELRQILKRLENPFCRLLTIGGKGENHKKELLALRAAAQISDKFKDGVFYFPLPQENIIASLNHAIAKIFPFHSQNDAENPLTVYQFFKEKSMLLVISNYVYSTNANELLEGILKRAPNVKIIVTGSGLLESSMEWIYDVSDNPPTDANPPYDKI